MNNANKWVVAAAILGMAVGAWGMRLYFDHTLASWDGGQRLVAHLSHELELDVKQRLRVAQILAENKDKADSLRRQRNREVVLLGRRIQDQIAMGLNREQVKKLQTINDNVHSRLVRYLWSEEKGPTALAIAPGR